MRPIAYYRPQVMRHRLADGRVEYAMHDVYFTEDGSVETYTVHARSDRKGSVDELEDWIRAKLPEAESGIICGDLGYVHDADDLSVWLKHVRQPPIDYEPDAEEGPAP